MSDSLQHYGVKGMKWGIRRYQNADGTLTKAGKKARAKDAKRFTKLMRKTQYHESLGETDGSLASRHWKQVEKSINRGEKIIKRMQKNYGKTAFNDMDNYTRYTAEWYLYNAGLTKSKPSAYQYWLKQK